MTDYKEEQINEIEALESIYPEEFEVMQTEPYHQFTISIKTDNYEEADDGAMCIFQFTYVANYPDEPPLMEIVGSENVQEEHLQELLDLLHNEARDNVGMVMVFTLVSVALEWLGKKTEEVEKNKVEEIERLAKEKEEAEQIRFEGKRVSVETFLSWKAQFDAEMAALRMKLQKEDLGSKKLTGRELFERDHTLNESDIQFMQEGEEDIKVDESLFQDLDDLDLDADVGDETD